MTRFFCNECSTDKSKGCTVKWPSSWRVHRPPSKGVCYNNPAPVWHRVKKDKITGEIHYAVCK